MCTVESGFEDGCLNNLINLLLSAMLYMLCQALNRGGGSCLGLWGQDYKKGIIRVYKGGHVMS